ncbi:hypothetical protein AB0C51_20175 [Streptomyces pathocidini]|uniref:hypothetical protein n=1 Tax=Streptomyces pathocidini TaxID=1650571 RepID=UPI0033DF3C19
MSSEQSPGAGSEPEPRHEKYEPGADQAARQHEPAPVRRGRRPGLVAACVAAAVLVAGGGGAYWASTASDESDSRAGGGRSAGFPAADGDDPPPLELDGYGRQHGGAAEGEGPGILPGEPDPNGARYRAEGPLPDGPGEAPVHRAQDGVSRDRAERLAKALGVAGEPRLVQDTWKFGRAGGEALDVSRTAPGTWTYVRGDGDARGGRPVSERAAAKAAGAVLDAIGLSGAKLDAGRTFDGVRVVNASPVLDRLPTYGWQTGLQIGADGQVVGGSGHLTELTRGPEYPVIGAGEALKLLNRSAGGSGRVGIGGCASAMPHEERGGGKRAGADGPHTLPCPPDGPVAKPRQVTVRDAVFGLAVHFVDGRQALVPSWLFEVGQRGSGDTFTVTYPAVEPKYIAEPGRRPHQPGREPGQRPSEEPERHGGTPVHISSYAVEGRTLTLTFWGGVCSTYSAAVERSTSREVAVEVTARDKKPGQVCIKIAKRFETQVTLDEPLGDRRVVDASTDKTVTQTR